mmetsp:Transcript_7486/g.26156  ORF Transcript_7486/g.26156 Transcript_7486/m.26156 type:complete len:378 (-) Transcript_7486:31-1164(-)
MSTCDFLGDARTTRSTSGTSMPSERSLAFVTSENSEIRNRSSTASRSVACIRPDTRATSVACIRPGACASSICRYFLKMRSACPWNRVDSSFVEWNDTAFFRPYRSQASSVANATSASARGITSSSSRTRRSGLRVQSAAYASVTLQIRSLTGTMMPWSTASRYVIRYASRPKILALPIDRTSSPAARGKMRGVAVRKRRRRIGSTASSSPSVYLSWLWPAMWCASSNTAASMEASASPILLRQSYVESSSLGPRWASARKCAISVASVVHRTLLSEQSLATTSTEAPSAKNRVEWSRYDRSVCSMSALRGSTTSATPVGGVSASRTQSPTSVLPAPDGSTTRARRFAALLGPLSLPSSSPLPPSRRQRTVAATASR